MDKKSNPVQPKTPSEIESKIEKINAYKSLLDKKFVIYKGVPANLHEEIEKEFKLWIESKIRQLMGEQTESKPTIQDFGLTSEEIATVKIMVQQVNNKISSPKAPPPPLPPQPRKDVRPLKEAVNMGDYNKKQMKILEDLRKLEEMDRKGPQF